MIDYDKLKLAHELAEKLPYDWYAIDAAQGTGACTNYYSLTFEDNEGMSHEYEFKHDDIDDLIAKLQELTQPKYTKGQEVWIIKKTSTLFPLYGVTKMTFIM